MSTRKEGLLAMPAGLAPALGALAQVFSEIIPDVPIVMGGGSVLAARWRHRDSTDIDLFVHPAAMASLTAEDRLRYQAVYSLLGNLGDVSLDWTSGFLSGSIMDAPFSLAASEFIRKDRQMSEVAASTCFFAATNHEILSGKIKGRLHRRGDFPARSPIRDLYDIVVAAQADPGVVGRVLQGVTSKGRSVIADDLRRLPDNLHETDPKPLMNAKCRFPLHGLPRMVAAAIESGDEALLPKAVRVAQDSDMRGGR